MKLKSNTIRPIAFGPDSAYRAAVAWHKHIGVDLGNDIADYLTNGWWVLSTPQMFALVSVVNIAPEDTNLVAPAWFIRYSRGNLLTLLQTMALHCGYFEYTLFCRNNEGDGAVIRKYRTERLFKIVGALNRRAKTSGLSNGSNRGKHTVADVGSIPTARSKKGENQWAAGA